MKTFIATLSRYNPQFNKNYTTTRTIEAKTIRSATKKAQEICNKCVYGSMSVVSVEPAEVTVE